MLFRSLLLFALFVGILGCSSHKSEETAQIRTDLDQVCRAQRSFLETRRLMQTVSEGELAKERQAHFQMDIKGSLVKEALAEAQKAPAGHRRHALDLAATKAGVKDWACPELDQL
jgi:hypothetical protein